MQFVQDTLASDGIALDPDKVEKNPALRTVGKLCCNGMWGNLGEKTLRSKTELVYSYEELVRIITDPSKEVRALVPLSDECLQVTWQPLQDTDESLPTSSIIHAAFTTCFGRLHLYKYLDVVRERVGYFDTDSVLFISRPGQPDLPLGTHLGDLTDQIEEDYGPGSFITEFCAGGPKNYGYVVAVGGDVNNRKVCIKVRGISINKSCDHIVTYETLKKMVLGEENKMVIPIDHQIARLPGWKIVTRSTAKTWQAANLKRRRVEHGRTVPHGFNPWHEVDEDDQDLLEALDDLMEN